MKPWKSSYHPAVSRSCNCPNQHLLTPDCQCPYCQCWVEAVHPEEDKQGIFDDAYFEQLESVTTQCA